MKLRKIWGTLDPFYEGGAVMGRSVANESFLRALLRLDPFDEYHFYLRDPRLAGNVAQLVGDDFPALRDEGRLVFRTREALASGIADTRYHAFHLSDCINHPAHLARLRNAVAQDVFPITGTTHSLSYTRYMSDFLAHMWEGATARDCVIATSNTAVSVVNAIYDHLSEHFGSLRRPVVERIPLGVDSDAVAPASSEQRTAARARFGIADEECAVLVFARISQHSKMDLVPILRAMGRLKGLGVNNVRLLLGGWTEDGDSYPDTVAELAANAGVRMDVFRRPDEAAKLALFHAADVFLSPVDNPQETFGLSVLEAAAAGLPAVVSDYDGYRDLVLHEETGLTVPTLGTDQTGDVDMLAPLGFDADYHLQLAQQTVVDVPAMAAALARLAGDAGLRRRLGEAARERAVREFSWAEVARRHVRLWDRLRDAEVDIESLRGHAHPLQMPFGRVFAGYASESFRPDLDVVWTKTGEAVYRNRDFVTIYTGIESRVDVETVKRMVFFARKTTNAVQLVGKLMESCGVSHENARFLVLWALKHDLLERVDAG